VAARHRPGHYEPVDDAEAMDAFELLCRTEGIIPAIESAHALRRRCGWRRSWARGDHPGEPVRRGDKDVETAGKWFGVL
jgi:tryptophan synthase beta chain